MIDENIIHRAVAALNKIDPKQSIWLERNVNAVAARWTEADGVPEAFYQFCLKQYVPFSEKKSLLSKIEAKLEKMLGLFLAIYWSNVWSITMQTGIIEPIDELFAKIDPNAHFLTDIYNSQLAFVILLNFPLLSLEEKNQLSQSAEDRFLLAQSRLSEMCQYRIPVEVSQESSLAATRTFQYLDQMIFNLQYIQDEKKNCLFNTPKEVDCHWGLRDQINLSYHLPDGLSTQKTLAKVWDRVVLEEIPAEFLSSKQYYWEPSSNQLTDKETKIHHSFNSFHSGRYKGLKQWFEAKQLEDIYNSEQPSYIDRSFNLQREYSEASVEQLLIEFLTNPLLPHCAAHLKSGLKRELYAFDIVFNQFELFHGTGNEEKYDDTVLHQFPKLTDFQAKIPNILIKLGFSKSLSSAIAQKINVVACRTGGFSSFPKMRGGEYLLAVATKNDKMDFMAFSTAMHELGHCVERYLSSESIDYYTLGEVPNASFTEAFAYLFDSKCLELLGINQADATNSSCRTLNLFWAAFLNCGIALVDMECWRWMYEHPKASIDQLKEAVINIARTIWNKYYASILGEKDSLILAGYSPMFINPLYMPDYALAIFIQTQLEVYLKDKILGNEMPRICGVGKVSPNTWMKHAVGEPISSHVLLNITELALKGECSSS